MSKKDIFTNVLIGVAVAIVVIGFFVGFFINKDGGKEQSDNEPKEVVQYEGLSERDVEHEEVIEPDSEEVETPDPEEVKENVDEYMDEVDLDAFTEYEEVEDYQAIYGKQFGEELVRQAKITTEEAIVMMLRSDLQASNWEHFVTDSFLEEIRVLNRAGSKSRIDTIINSLQIFADKPVNEDEFIYSVVVDIGDSITFWQVSFTKDGLVNNIELMWEM